jgi:glutathione synthase/RimK-type ligase-like ATP-grasp enzyme
MPRIALVTAIAAHALDDDMPPLLAALYAAGVAADMRAWDDPTVAWSRYDIVLLRSTWDYTIRLDAFLDWCGATSRQTRLLNPLEIVRWNTDKRYLAQLESIGIPIVPTEFLLPGDDPGALIAEYMAQHPGIDDFVIKPTVGAGSRGARRHARGATDAMTEHARGLLDAGRSVLVQPYLTSVDTAGETALLYFDGVFSHAIRKGPLLRPDEDPTRALFAAEHIQPRKPSADERELADRVIAALPLLVDSDYPLAYARVDLIRAANGSPCVLELELAEPSVFLDHDAGAAERFVDVLKQRLG